MTSVSTGLFPGNETLLPAEGESAEAHWDHRLSGPDRKRSPVEMNTIQCSDGFLRIAVIKHFHKRKAPRVPGFPIRHDFDTCDFPVGREQVAKLLLCRLEIQVTDVNPGHARFLGQALLDRFQANPVRNNCAQTPQKTLPFALSTYLV